MEISFLKSLINSVSQFNHFSSCCDTKSELIRKYYHKIDEALKFLRPILDEIVKSEIASDGKLNKALEELDVVVNEAGELMESWQQMTSKLCFVFQIESLITKIQKSGLEICRLLNSLLQSLTSDSLCIQQCIQRFQLIGSEQASDVIKEVLRCLQENTTPNSESLVKIANNLSLISNQELLLEAVALEKVKTKVDQDKINGVTDHIDHMVALVTVMHDNLIEIKQCKAINGVPIPPDFCCPLSLELMSDPVIVASGQTYERAYIRIWLDQGLTVCPKTRQTLSHTNLIPNYTVKALIANWCELNNVKLLDPVKSASLNQLPLLPSADSCAGDPLGSPHMSNALRMSGPRSPDSIKYMVSSHQRVSSNGNHNSSTIHLNSSMEGGPPLDTENVVEVDMARVSPGSSKDTEIVSVDEKVGSDGQALISSREDLSVGDRVDEQFQGHNRSASVSSAIANSDYQGGVGDATEASRSGDLTHYSSDASGELISEASTPAPPRREPELSQLAEPRGGSNGKAVGGLENNGGQQLGPSPGVKDGGSTPKPAQEKKAQVSAANEHGAAPAAKAQVVGWPPIRSFRKNTMATNPVKNGDDAEGKLGMGCLYVKVSMDGAPYLRKVDLKTYSNYVELSSALEKMFSCFTIGQCGSHGVPGREGLTESRLMDLLHGSEYVLTYEDKDGDWMLVGDVPWEMFTDSCRRLRIMKGSEAIGLAPRAMEKCKNRN